MLLLRSAAILKDVIEGIRFLLGKEEGKDMVITPLLIARIKNLFFDISKEGSEELGKTLKMLSNLIEEYEGMRVSKIWQTIDKKQPEEFALFQNFANPFNPDTWIPYQLAKGANVTIKIYNVAGQLVRTLSLGYKDAGFYTNRDKAAYWDGKDSFGEKVASGVYFYTLQAGEFKVTRKMAIVK